MAKAITDVALIGLGAVGAAYLTSVADNFPECRIRVIAAGERAERLRSGGIVYNGKRYMFDIAEPQEGTPAGLLFVSVKNGRLAEAMEQAAAFVGPETVIISPLNGVTSEKRLAGRFGAEKVVYSYAIKLDATRRGAETVCGNEGWIVFGVEWACAVAGITMNAIAMNNKVVKAICMVLYCVTGWMALAVFPQLLGVLTAAEFGLLLAGGIAYTVGIVFFALGKKVRWFHSVWHLFDIAGTALQFASILLILLG